MDLTGIPEKARFFLPGGISVFGIEDVQIQLAYALSIGATVLCIAYGAVKWNEVD
jgi:hypothetical protein